MRDIIVSVVTLAGVIFLFWFTRKFPFVFIGIMGAICIFLGIAAFVAYDDKYGAIVLGVIYILMGLFVFICLISGLREKK